MRAITTIDRTWRKVVDSASAFRSLPMDEKIGELSRRIEQPSCDLDLVEIYFTRAALPTRGGEIEFFAGLAQVARQPKS